MTFRRPYWRVALGTACACALCPVMFWYAGLLPEGQGPEVTRACTFMAVALVALAAVGVLRAARDRIVLDERGLRLRGLLGRRMVAWERVAEVAAPWGFYADVPLVLKLPPVRGGWLGRLLAPRVAITGHWADHARLVREVAAHATRARLNRRLRAYLAAPGRVPWPHRVLVLASLGASVALGVYALCDALAEGVIGVIPGGLVVAAGLSCSLTGASMGREGRAKAALVVLYPVLVLGLALAAVPAFLHGLGQWLLLLLAACPGWAAATFVACLPVRVRPGRAAAAYAVALAAAICPAWYWGVREPVPSASLGPLHLADTTLVWSPDGARLGVHIGESGSGRDAYLVIERPSLRTWQLPLVNIAERLYLLDGGRALYLTNVITRDNATQTLDSIRTFWFWDAALAEPRRVPAAPRLRIAAEGLVAPDGRRAAFLARDDATNRWHLDTLDLADLAVARLESPFDFSRFRAVRWTPDGAMLLTERWGGDKLTPSRLGLWRLAPGAAEPVRFYEVTAPDLWDQYSPDLRWALVALFQGGRRVARHDIVDLRTGQTRRVDLPGAPFPHRLAWAPDGGAIAYAADDGRGPAVVRFHLATGNTQRLPLRVRGDVTFVALSAGGRYAACVVRGERATRVRVADLDTGRLTFLRRPMLFPAPPEPSWSRAGHTLAVTWFEQPLPPASTVRIRLFDFARGL